MSDGGGRRGRAGGPGGVGTLGRHVLGAFLAALLLSTASTEARATVLSEDEFEEESTELGVIARAFTFLMAGDVLDQPYNLSDQTPSGMGLFDLRLYFGHSTPDFKFVVHEQWTTALQSHALESPLMVGRGVPPPRWLPLHYTFTDLGDETIDLRRDVDWLYAAYSPGPVTITVGRQPVSFGRGRLWHTNDLISTFSLTEVDTEYKPGADGIRIDWSLAEQASLTAVAAVGEVGSDAHDLEADLQGSSFLTQLKLGWDWGEIAMLAGMVRYDAVLGIDGVLDTGAFDLHGELTATQVSSHGLGAPAVDDTSVPVFKALVGATIRPVDEWTIIPEAHFNGFGAWEAEDYLPVALSPRVAMGEQASLGKLYLGISNDLELHPLWHVVSAQIVNLTDPSGLLLLGLNHNLADNVEIYAGAYVPMGRLPAVQEGFSLRSEFGNYPYFVFTELKGVI